MKCDNCEEHIQDNYDYLSGYSIICWIIQLNDKIENSCEYKLIVVGKALSVCNFSCDDCLNEENSITIFDDVCNMNISIWIKHPSSLKISIKTYFHIPLETNNYYIWITLKQITLTNFHWIVITMNMNYMYDNYQEIIKFNSLINNGNNICIINLHSSIFDKTYDIFNRNGMFIQ